VRLNRDGSLAEVADRHGHAGHGPVVSRQDCAHVHSTAFNSAGDRLVAADLGADALVVYDFDATPLVSAEMPGVSYVEVEAA
jgi:6-phosphogluconolactonase